MTRPAPTVMSSILRRPKRSARLVRGRAPSDASRMTASPMPRAVPDNPAWSARVAPWLTWPNPRATSPRAATTPNCPNPEAKAATATPTTARSFQRCRWSPAGRGARPVPGLVLKSASPSTSRSSMATRSGRGDRPGLHRVSLPGRGIGRAGADLALALALAVAAAAAAAAQRIAGDEAHDENGQGDQCVERVPRGVLVDHRDATAREIPHGRPHCHPGDGANGVAGQKQRPAHAGDAGHQPDGLAQPLDKTGHHDHEPAAPVDESLGLVQALAGHPHVAAVAQHEHPAADAADRVADGAPGDGCRHRDQPDGHDVEPASARIDGSGDEDGLAGYHRDADAFHANQQRDPEVAVAVAEQRRQRGEDGGEVVRAHGRSRQRIGGAVACDAPGGARTAIKSRVQPTRYWSAGRAWPGTAAVIGPPGVRAVSSWTHSAVMSSSIAINAPLWASASARSAGVVDMLAA